MKVYLDDIEVAFPNNTLLEPKFSLRRSTQTEGAAISFTGELNFTGSDYDYIYKTLVTDVNAINQKVILKFIDDCCDNKEYIFVIKPESLQWCENSCEISANALEYSVDSAAYACFENTLIWDNYNGFQEQEHPRIPYCLEYRPNVLQDLMIIFSIATLSMIGVILPLLFIIGSIVATINNIIGAINSLGANISTLGDIEDVGDLIDNINAITDPIAAFAVGCNYDHPSPLVRSYITNVCNKCGVSFSSSIYNDPDNDYWDTVYFSAQIRKGQSAGDFYGGLTNYIGRNKPILNLKQFLDEIVQPVNGRWDIHDGVLRLERRDFFENQSPFFDVTTYEKDNIISECYTWTKNPRPSYGQFYYSKDALDWVGCEAIERWSDIVEWNDPYTPTQKGVLQKDFPFGAARFRGDNLDRDVLSDYKWAPFGIGKAIKDNGDVLLLNNGTAFLPKLLILRKGWQSNFKHCLIENDYTTYHVDDKDDVYPNEAYNYPFWVREGSKGNLYDRFWYIEDPRLTTFKGYDFEIKITWDCETLNSINIDGTINTSQGLGKVNTIDLDFTKSEMTIKGTV